MLLKEFEIPVVVLFVPGRDPEFAPGRAFVEFEMLDPAFPKMELTPPVAVPIRLEVVLVRTGGGPEGVEVIPVWPNPGLAEIP
jgi:hypothetical protein